MLYRFDNGRLSIIDRIGGGSVTFFTGLKWQKFPYTDDEWNEKFFMGINGPLNLNGYKTLLYIPISNAYSLIKADEELWIVREHGDKIWSVHSLVPQSIMGSAVWAHEPMRNAASPYFEFMFDFEYEHITAVCSKGMLYGYDESKTDIFPDAFTQYYNSGDSMKWSPGPMSIIDKSAVHFTAVTEEMSFSGTIYIERDDEHSRMGSTCYTAAVVGERLFIYQDEDTGRAIISLR